MTRWLRTNGFAIAVIVTVLTILISCLIAFRALDDLPNSHREIVNTEEQIGRLSSLRFSLGTAASRLRALTLGGDEQDHRELVEAIARCEQLLEVLDGVTLADPLEPILKECQIYLSEIRPHASNATSLSVSDKTRLRDRATQLRARLEAIRLANQDYLAGKRIAAERERREAVWALIGGHALMLALVGLLYVARRGEQRLRQLADLRTLEADERFALIVRGSSDGIILTDERGRILMTNPAFEQMFQSDEASLKGTAIGSLLTTTVIDEWLANRLNHGDRESTLSRRVKAMRPNGSRLHTELTITPQTIRDQEFLAISVRDVSEREASRLRLKQHEALLSEILEPLHILDAVGRVVYWNRGAQHLYGFEAREVIGQTANDLLRIVPPRGNDNNIHAVEYAEAERWSGELMARTKAGKGLRIERRRTRIREANETIGEVVLDLDLGERNRLQQVERRRQRLESLGTLASGIAHDLNNLLTPILMSCRMLQRKNANVDRDALLETIGSGASRGADLIAQLLTFARGGEGEQRPIRVDEIIPEVAAILQATLPPGIKLETQIGSGLSQVLGDATEISQVVMNLAINARDAMSASGELKISVSPITLATERSYAYATLQPGDYLSITVSDTGTGIPKNLRERMFDPFFTTKERGQGTGLGLSTTIGIVRSHEGAVEVRSTVGQGTRISVILPALPHSYIESLRGE
ncbi:Wide host range VirA protein [Novipirellula galeiformis]|uniref:histidine kinase n=1 Tax=Novipirellula galeiformis TaxID=2528004 RepID=A0A5C6CQG8_9BACT|nr:ATP-binding protein [Novipirellula galeiformis]TWU25059.1 Wide host range VirA protein [Novipirellula galeiformis]